ncbi:MAG TPA: MMPL family transporter [Balneolaceae bacterium]|nr:MMPL family transporter [Balneolaceae bacterium]
MDRVLRFLRPLLTLNYKYPYAVVTAAIITAVIGGFFGARLKVDTDLTKLLPRKNPHVQALDSLKKTVGGESKLTVAIVSPSFKDNIHFAKDLIHKSLQLYDKKKQSPFFDRGEYKRDTKFLKNNALYFATSRELNDITAYLKNQIESSNKKANPFLVNFNDNEKQDTTEKKLKDFEKSYNTLIPSKYSISPDSTILLVNLEPTGSKTNLAYLGRLFTKFDSLVTAMNPHSYNKKMRVLYSGRLRHHLLQLNSIRKDVYNSFATGLSSIILLVMLYFFIKKYLNYRRGSFENKHGFWSHVIRMPVSVIVIGLPLLISLTWTFGITYWVLGMLNTMTSVLFVILFGMGIDYGIHFYARYLEIRSAGQNVEQALYQTYDNTGAAIVVSGLTTAFSLLVLMFARFRGFSEFGFIAGIGIILALVCMLFVLPALVVIFEDWSWILINPKHETASRSSSAYRFPFARTIVAIGLMGAVAVVVNYHHLHFQYNFGKLEPTFKQYKKFGEIAGQAGHGHKRNPAYLLADNRKQVQEIADTLRHRMRSDTTSPTILDVEALPERFPITKKQINAKLKKIAHIRKLLNNPVIKSQHKSKLDTLRRAAQTTHPISINQIPDYFKNKFTTKNGKVGNFVIVYPSVTLADSRKSIEFTKDVGEVTLASGKKVYAASTSIIAAQIMELLEKESPWLVGATLVMVFLLMLFSFRSLKWTLIAIAPLVIGLLSLFGIMMLAGMKLNLYNLIVLPAILGIGEDNGVHVASRYLEEGHNSVWEVLSSTGQHITIGSVTTMLGFSGLLFTDHPGLQSMGAVAITGIGMTLITALVFLPALIQWLEDRQWIEY